MTLHLLRFDPDPRVAAMWFHGEQLAPRDQDDDGYAWHALLTAVFGPSLAPKPFRVMVRRGRPLHLLAYSAHDGATLGAHAAQFAEARAKKTTLRKLYDAGLPDPPETDDPF